MFLWDPWSLNKRAKIEQNWQNSGLIRLQTVPIGHPREVLHCRVSNTSQTYDLGT